MSTNNSEQQDYFLETLTLARVSPRKFRYRLRSDHFSQHEKILLKAYRNFILGKKEHALSDLKRATIPSPFLKGVQHYLMGIIYNHFGTFKFALEHLTKSVAIFSEIGERNFSIQPLILTVIVLSNQKNVEELPNYINILSSYEAKDDRLYVMQMHAIAVAQLELERDLEAKKTAQDLLNYQSEAVQNFKPGLYIILFTIALRAADYDLCQQLLEDYKKSDGLIVRENYHYMNALLQHICHDQPLYIYDYEFNKVPELYDQLQVIQLLARADLKNAAHVWSKLQSHNSKLYLDNFHYNGPKNLFSLALKKYQETILKIDPATTQPVESLEELFEYKGEIIPKGEIVKALWNEEPNEKNLARLRKMVSRLNKKNNSIRIVSYHDAYKKIA